MSSPETEHNAQCTQMLPWDRGLDSLYSDYSDVRHAAHNSTDRFWPKVTIRNLSRKGSLKNGGVSNVSFTERCLQPPTAKTGHTSSLRPVRAQMPAQLPRRPRPAISNHSPG